MRLSDFLIVEDYDNDGGVPHHYANSTKMADTTPASFKNSYNTNCVMPPTTTAEDMSVLDLSAKPCKEASIMGPTLSGHTAGPGPGGVDCGRPGHGGQSTGSPGAGSASTSDDGDSPLDIKPSTSSSSDMTKMFQFPSLPGLVPPHPNTSMAGNAYNFTPMPNGLRQFHPPLYHDAFRPPPINFPNNIVLPQIQTPRLPGGQPTMNGMFFGPHNMFPSPFGPAMMKDPLSNPLDSIDLLKNISKTSMGSLSSQDLSNMASFNTMNALGDPPVYPSSILEIKQDIEARLRRNEARQNGKRKSSSTVTSPPPSTMSRAPSPSSSEPDSKRMCTEEDDDDPHKELKDAAYMDRRKKNNEAAKRSRDARRVKEMKIARRCMFLEEENLKLKTQVELLRQETQRLHKILYNVGQQR